MAGSNVQDDKPLTRLQAAQRVASIALGAASAHAERLQAIIELAEAQRAEPIGGYAPGALAIRQINDLHNLILGVPK